MNYLKNRMVYLAGPIQFDENHKNWRTKITEKLEKKFKLNVFDPFEDPKQQWMKKYQEYKNKKEYEKIQNSAKKCIDKDLTVIDRSDFLIAYLPHKVATVGTVHEIIHANKNKKPTLLVTDQNNIGEIPFWYFGIVPLEFMFPNWDQLFLYLKKVKKDEGELHKRWNYIHNKI